MEFDDNSTECVDCRKPLVWISRIKRLHQGREVHEFDFRCDSCKREFRFRDGKLKELKNDRDPVAEHIAMRQAEIDTVRNQRCPHCGGPLDDWLTCDWCHERYSVDNGELMPRIQEQLQHKAKVSDFKQRYKQFPKLGMKVDVVTDENGYCKIAL